MISRCCIGCIATLLTMAFAAGAAPASSPQLGREFRCNYAKIKPPGATPYSHPKLLGRHTHLLRAGSPVYVCDETASSYQVFYAARGKRCPGTVNGLENERAKQCAVG